MKISYKCDYALKIILDLADYYPHQLVHRSEIARRQDVPEKFLEQILRSLIKGGFVQSKKGPNGGYSLSRPPKEISLGEVICLIEGSVYPISCVEPEAPPTCDFVPRCVFYDIWKEVGKTVAQIVDNINFEQLQQKASRLREEEAITYYI
jgi:Rrf2 family protein